MINRTVPQDIGVKENMQYCRPLLAKIAELRRAEDKDKARGENERPFTTRTPCLRVVAAACGHSARGGPR